MTEAADKFDWSASNEDIIQHSVQGVAVYINTRGNIVIRQEANWPDDNEDTFIELTWDAATALSGRLPQLIEEAKREFRKD